MSEISHHMSLTLVLAAFFGVFFIVSSKKLRTSAITFLLIGGVLLGPEVLGIIQPAALGSEVLSTIVSLAVALILFEGGLTLDLKEARKISREILGVLTMGVLVTFLATALSIWFIFRFPPTFCALAASLVIVTGPTVIGPLLHRVRVREHLHHLLHWEGVLIDPLGVFVALLFYEWIVSAGVTEAPVNFVFRFGAGAVVGLIAGVILQQILKRRLIPEESLNICVVAGALATFGLADALVSESGLLSVTVAGLWIGSHRTPNLKQIIEYKSELKDLLIGLLFVLLAANLRVDQFKTIGWGLAIVLGLVMFVIRPLNIFISARKSGFTTRDKLFLSWIAPRGIVAASMASLFALNLESLGIAHADFLEPFAYSVIAGTVLIQAMTAKPVARMLGVLVPKPAGLLIVGAHRLGRAVGKFLHEQGVHVVLVDTNYRRIVRAKKDGLVAITGNGLEISPDFHLDLYGIGHVLSITSNAELNRLICMRWKALMGDISLYFWSNEALSDNVAHDHLKIGDRIWPDLESEVFTERIGTLSVEDLDLGETPEIAREHVLMATFGEKGLYPGLPEEEREGAAVCLLLKTRSGNPRRKPSLKE